jgi:glutamine amidotransferase
MCRMFAYAAPALTNAEDELESHGVASITALARLHADGWGWAGVGGDNPLVPEVTKSPLPASTDPNFVSALALPARAAMVHLRWATLGLQIEADNTHPFLHDGISFEHNGSLKPIERMRSLLSEDSLARMQGMTDSEMYFALIREHSAHSDSLPEATVAAARQIRANFPASSLNAMLLSPRHLIVVHSSAKSVLDAEDLVEAAQFDLPDEHADDYFALRWRRKKDGTVVVASSGLSEPDWEPIPAETVMVVSLADCSVQMLPLF